MFLVFDIGGTNTRIATSSDGKTLENTQIFPTEKNFENQIQIMGEIAEKIKETDEIETVSGGVAGSFNPEKSTLNSSPNLPEWIQRPIKEEFENAFNAPVYLENDALLGGLGEACFGAGQDFNVVAFITIGTGIGGAKIIDKKIDRNILGFEPGHQIIRFDGDPCNCGGKGHLEPYIAGAYLKKLYGAEGENIKDPKVWDEISKYLAVGLNNTIVHWSPEVIVLSGSVGQKIPIEVLQSHLDQELRVFPTPPIVRGTLDHEAGLYGALKIVQQSRGD